MAVETIHSSWTISSPTILTALISFMSLWLIRCLNLFGSSKHKAAPSNDESSAHNDTDVSPVDAIVVFGTQTGTAETYAKRIGKVLAQQCGLEIEVTDLENFEMERLLRLPNTQSAAGNSVFLVLLTSTYGDGEPPDNTIGFHTSIKNASDGKGERPLDGLNYAIFGFGNSSYELFNKQAEDYDQFFGKLGGKKLCAIGAGDDNTGTTDEDFQDWKDKLLDAVASNTGIDVHKASSTTTSVQIREETRSQFDEDVYLGEKTEPHLHNNGLTIGPFTASNPYYAPVRQVKQLYNPSCERKCLHIEFDITGSNLIYETGDHLAVWPIKPEVEIERMLRVLGLMEKRTTIFRLASTVAYESVDLPNPTTYEAAVRYYLDICGPVSRSCLEPLSAFAPSAVARNRILELARDKGEFETTVHTRMMNLAQLLELASNQEPWPALPFNFILDNVPLLRPRHYSISSSSEISPRTIHLTVAINETVQHDQHSFTGLASRYLTAVASLKDVSGTVGSHQLKLARSQHDDVRVAIHTRQSQFRLPKDPSKSILMIGPGTGIAPFRAFLAEIEQRSREGQISKCMLFTGCRRRDEDFMYEEEWQSYQRSLKGQFELHTAFSREGPQKVYVQHRLKEQSVCNMLDRGDATVYICGDVKMAKDVTITLADILVQHRSSSVDDARQFIAEMKASGRFQEDVW